MKKLSFCTSLVILFLALILTACHPKLRELQINAVSGEPTVIDLEKALKEKPTDAPIYFYLKTKPNHGKLEGPLPKTIYTSLPSYEGKDTFTFMATYKDNKSNPVKVTIKVAPRDLDDLDGDLVNNSEDAFPSDPAEIYDTDKNGVGNFAQKDEDGDGVLDEDDAFPFDKKKTALIETAEREFNDNINDATTVSTTIPFEISGVISQSVDSDLFAFQATKANTVSILLNYSDSNFSPRISVINQNGIPVTALAHKIISKDFVGYTAQIDQAGKYYIQITDGNSKNANTFTYTARVFIDNDFDLVSDEQEIALGSIKNQNDSDQDSILDFYEIIVANNSQLGFDVDLDGIPNWLDKDSDGNFVSDKEEGMADIDNDGQPNFIDLDNDGNGIPDKAEIGIDPSNPKDTDGDGVADFSDIDDDNDGLNDSIDPDRLTPIRFSNETDINDRLLVFSIGYTNGGKQVLGNLIQGKLISLKGRGFSTNADGNKVVLKTKNGYRLLAVERAAENEITFSMPEVDASELFVIRNNQVRSATLKVTTLSKTSPIIYQPNKLSLKVGDKAILQGENFTSASTINAAGVSVSPSFVSPKEIHFIVPNNANTGKWFVISENGKSNRVHVSITKASNTRVILPSGYPVAVNKLYISAPDFKEYKIDENGGSQVTINNNKPDTLDVVVNWKGSDAISLQAITVQTDTRVDISVESTAVANALSLVSSFKNLPADKANKAREQVKQLAEVKILARLIRDNIIADPSYISGSDTAFIKAKIAAMKKAAAIVKSFTNKGIASRAIQPPDITQEQHDIKVNATESGTEGYTGDISVENDTQLYLSTQIKNKANGEVLFSHVGSYVDDQMVPSQSDVLFSAGVKEDFDQSQFRDADVEIISGIRAGAFSSNSVNRYVSIRTLFEKAVYPVITQAVGDKIDSKLLLLIFIDKYPQIIDISYNLAAKGDIDAAAKKILKTLLDDLITGGSISKGIVSIIGGNVAEQVQKRIAKRIVQKLIPIVNIFSTLSDVATVGLFAANYGKAYIDLTTIPNKLDFEVIWPLQIHNFTPKAHDQSTGGLNVSFKGIALNKTERVLVEDMSDDGAGSTSLQLVASNFNYTKASLDIPSDWIKNATGPLAFIFYDKEGQAKKVDKKIELTAKVLISQLTPNFVNIEDEVCIEGSGFSRRNSKNQIFLKSVSGYIPQVPSYASKSKLCLTVPSWAVSGDIYVKVNKGSQGIKQSNSSFLSILKSKVLITFGDNGTANDDTFALLVNGTLMRSMGAPARKVGPIEINNLKPGVHTVSLRGITAPDAIGTFYIRIQGQDVQSITGPALTGTDLIAGAQKSWLVKVKPSASSRSIVKEKDALISNSAIPVEIIWDE